MGPMASYVLRLACGSLFSGLLLSLAGGNGSSGKILKHLCGLFLIFLAISPIKELELSDLIPELEWYHSQGADFIQQGEKQAQEAFSELINDQYRAYILTRAEELSLSPEVSITTDPESGIIQELILQCNATPGEKQLLTDLLCRDLGIERSAVHWKT